MSRDEEVAVPLKPVPSSPTEEYYRSIFDRVDTDGDGVITVRELRLMLENSEELEGPLTPEVEARIHQAADRNQDGYLDYQEFVEMINNPKFNKFFGHYVNKYVNFVIPRKKLGGLDLTDGQIYEDEYSCCPPKLGMIVISIVEFILFVIDEVKEENSTQYATGPIAKILIYDPTKRFEIWRYISYMFVHIGYLHLAVNLVVQIFIGIPLEMVHDWWRVLVIYFAGVLAGSLGTSITDPTAKLAGASGGVYSLITAHIATIIMNWKEMSFPGVQLLIFVLITGVDVGTSIYTRYWTKTDDHIGYMAHFAGALAGLLVGIVILKNLNITKKENYIWWAAIGAYVVLMLIALVWNIFFSDYFPH